LARQLASPGVHGTASGTSLRANHTNSRVGCTLLMMQWTYQQDTDDVVTDGGLLVVTQMLSDGEECDQARDERETRSHQLGLLIKAQQVC
jgi:hypothetical protein